MLISTQRRLRQNDLNGFLENALNQRSGERQQYLADLELGYATNTETTIRDFLKRSLDGEIVLKNYKFCFAHLEAVGFDMGGRVSENGLSLQKIISKIDHTFTGHFHNRSNRETLDGKTFCYVGSPYQITRIDRNQERGYLILDTDTEEYTWHNNNQSMKFQVFTYPNVDKTRVKGHVVDLHIPFDKQDETKKIYDLVKELDGLFPAYPVNTFNDEPPVGENVELTIETERFNIMNMAKSYIDQLELKNVTNEELFKALEELYDQFKGTDD